jgi:hypothetical protein
MRRHLLAVVLPLALVFADEASAFAQEMGASPPALAPPPPMDPGAPSAPGAPAASENATTQKLDEAEHEDSGRNFELFWVDAHVGGSYIDMRQFSSESLQIEKANSSGPVVSLGAGLRFVVLVLGVRAKYNALSAFNMWQLNGEVGLKVPISKVDILVGLHGGYSFVGTLSDGAMVAGSSTTPTNADAVKIRGFNAGLDLGGDYYITKYFSVGAGFFGDFLFLNRPAIEKPVGLPPEQAALLDANPLYKASGTSAGLQLGGVLRIGGHFGL